MKEQYLSNLKNIISFLTNLEEPTWHRFQQLFSIRCYKKGEYFVEAGDYPTELSFVGSGVFRAFYRNKNGVEYNKTFFCKNTLMAPLTSLIHNSQNHINLQALADSDLLVADYKSITNLYDSFPSLERFARKAIEIEWCKKELREIRLVLNSAEERYEFFR